MSELNSVNKMIKERSLLGADYLSTRSSLFTAYAIVGICLMVPSFAGDRSVFALSMLLSLGVSVVMILLWTFTFRFFENPDMLPVDVVINLIPAVVAGIFLKDKISLEGLVFISGGLTCFAITSSEKVKKSKLTEKGFNEIDFLNGEFVKASDFIIVEPSSEVFVPLTCALITSYAGIVITTVIEKLTGAHSKGLRILIASILLILISFIVSKIRGRDFIISSKNLSDPTRLPTVSYTALRSFLLRRLRFAISFVLIAAGCLLCDYINLRFELGFPFMKHILAILLVFAFAFIRGRHSHHKVQFTLELGIILAVCVTRCIDIESAIKLTLAGIFADMVINGLLYTHNRRLIMSTRSRYVAGLPLELMSIAVVVMVFEVLLEYGNVVL